MLYYTSFLQILVPRPSSRDRTDGPLKEVLIHLPIYKPSTWEHLWWPDIAEPAETWGILYPRDKKKKKEWEISLDRWSVKVTAGWVPSFHSGPFLWGKWWSQARRKYLQIWWWVWFPDYLMGSLLYCLPLSLGKQFCTKRFLRFNQGLSPMSQDGHTSSVLKLQASLDTLAVC